jgi:hypothetical protein
MDTVALSSTTTTTTTSTTAKSVSISLFHNCLQKQIIHSSLHKLKNIQGK